MNAFRDLFGGIELYSARAAVAAKPDDIVVLRESYPDYLDDLRRQNLGAYKYLQIPGEGCIVASMLQQGWCIDLLRQEAERCNLECQFFITEKSARDMLGAAVPGMKFAGSRFNLVQEINDKAEAREMFRERHLALPPGAVCANDKDIRRVAQELRRQGVKRIAMKDPCPYAASGKGKMGEIRAGGTDQQFAMDLHVLLEQYKGFRGKKKVILERWYESVSSSPSVIGNVTQGGRLEFIASTTQIMEPGGVVYKGSIIPAQVSEAVLLELYRIFQIVGEYLVKRGWVGVFGIDFIVIRDAGRELVMPTEINGRYTGSMYLANIMRRLCLDGWLGYSSNITVPYDTTYSCLRTAIELVEDKRTMRIIPLNIGPLALGKATIAVLVHPAASADPVRFAETVRDTIKDLLPSGRQYYELSA